MNDFEKREFEKLHIESKTPVKRKISKTSGSLVHLQNISHCCGPVLVLRIQKL